MIRREDDPAAGPQLVAQRKLGDTAVLDAGQLIWDVPLWGPAWLRLTLRRVVAATVLLVLGTLTFGAIVALLDRRHVILQNTLLVCAAGIEDARKAPFRDDVFLKTPREWQQAWCWWVPR